MTAMAVKPGLFVRLRIPKRMSLINVSIGLHIQINPCLRAGPQLDQHTFITVRFVCICLFKLLQSDGVYRAFDEIRWISSKLEIAMNCRTALGDEILILDLDRLQSVSGQSICVAF